MNNKKGLTKNSYKETDKGLVRTIILIVIALIALGYFGFNLREIISSPTVQDNLQYGKEIAFKTWDIIKGPVLMIWGVILAIISKLISRT